MEGSVAVGSPDVLARHGIALSRGGGQGKHVVVRPHVRVVGCGREEGWLRGFVEGRMGEW